MTKYRDLFKAQLINHGMFEVDADSILALVSKDREDTKDLADVINKDADGYPKMMTALLWLTVKRLAVEWLTANKPMHWALPMFDGTAEQIVAEEKALAETAAAEKITT